MEACKLDAEPLERWSALERVAEAAGDDVARVAALEAIAMRVGSRGRVAVFKRLARAHERRGDIEAAERAWQRVLALDAEDEEADHAVEASIVERGRYDELAEHLARRADRLSGQSEKKEMLRAVRLRRAAILEQRLGREQDACDELSLLLAEWPSSPGALRYLADLLERRGEHAKAVRSWERAAALETDPVGRRRTRAAGRKGGSGLGRHGGRARARVADSADGTGAQGGARAARRGGPASSARTRCSAIRSRRLRPREAVDPLTRSELLLEAAQASARAGNPRGAPGAGHARRRSRTRARDAAAARPRARIPLARRGSTRRSASDDRRTRVDPRIDRGARRGASRVLLAEALDVVQGRGAGLRELEAARAQIGDHPLLGLGLAERFAAMGQASAAVDEYRVALRGSLLDLRKGGSVALHAAEAAMRADRDQDAAHFVDLAQTDPDSRVQAQAIRRASSSACRADLGGAARRGAGPIVARRAGGRRPPRVDPGVEGLCAACARARAARERRRRSAASRSCGRPWPTGWSKRGIRSRRCCRPRRIARATSYACGDSRSPSSRETSVGSSCSVPPRSPMRTASMHAPSSTCCAR